LASPRLGLCEGLLALPRKAFIYIMSFGKDSYKMDIKEEILGNQKIYGYSENGKATDMFHEVKKIKGEEEEDNEKSHVIYN
jgi:hypothetical protein